MKERAKAELVEREVAAWNQGDFDALLRWARTSISGSLIVG